jgi:hypothetical protein
MDLDEPYSDDEAGPRGHAAPGAGAAFEAGHPDESREEREARRKRDEVGSWAGRFCGWVCAGRVTIAAQNCSSSSDTSRFSGPRCLGQASPFRSLMPVVSSHKLLVPQIREERRRERERERRLEAKDAHGTKKSKLTRDRDRDISEKVRGEGELHRAWESDAGHVEATAGSRGGT